MSLTLEQVIEANVYAKCKDAGMQCTWQYDPDDNDDMIVDAWCWACMTIGCKGPGSLLMPDGDYPYLDPLPRDGWYHFGDCDCKFCRGGNP